MAKRITLDKLAERAEIDSKDILWLNRRLGGDVIAIKQLEVGEEVVAYKIRKNYRKPKSIEPFYRYMEILRDESLDIGKGNCEYGFHMPLPENGERRELILYKRR